MTIAEATPKGSVPAFQWAGAASSAVSRNTGMEVSVGCAKAIRKIKAEMGE